MNAAYKIDRDAVGWLGTAQQAATDRWAGAGRRLYAGVATANPFLE